MQPFLSLLGLPASLLILLLQSPAPSQAATLGELWPYNLAPGEKYWPEDGPYRKRDLDAFYYEFLKRRTSVAVRKMGLDEGQKFWPHDWQWENAGLPPTTTDEPTADEALRRRGVEDGAECFYDSTFVATFNPPLLLHSNGQSPVFNVLVLRAFLQSRDFKCPTGTSDCSSIKQPDKCCTNGETCVPIVDTGLGTVGCCAAGQTCGGNVGSCDARNGYTPCSQELGGGCCIPGYSCEGIGCIAISTTSIIVTRTLTSTTVTSLLPLPTTTYTGPQTTLSCHDGFRACPVNQGGGCCATDSSCGVVTCTATTTESSTSATTAPASSLSTPGPAVRPTTVNTTSLTGTATTATTITSDLCPTGYYACEAFYRGGCCRTGRNCDTTSCPPTASTTIVNAAGVTIVVPVSDSGSDGTKLTRGGTITSASASVTASRTQTCGSAWSLCGSNGGGCCPGGFSCGTVSCYAPTDSTYPNGGTLPKQAPSAATTLNAPIRMAIIIMAIFLTVL